jgi:hypothetical protein
MSAPAHSHDATPYVTEALEPILAEMLERIDEDPDEGVLAIQAAVHKAIFAGFRQGWISLRFQLELQGVRVEVADTSDGADRDLWAELHGAGRRGEGE